MAINIGGNDEGEAMSDINVTPLVDVMLVLLIIFIITIRVIIPAGASCSCRRRPICRLRPSRRTSPSSINKDGDIFWNTQRVGQRRRLEEATS